MCRDYTEGSMSIVIKCFVVDYALELGTVVHVHLHVLQTYDTIICTQCIQSVQRGLLY